MSRLMTKPTKWPCAQRIISVHSMGNWGHKDSEDSDQTGRMSFCWFCREASQMKTISRECSNQRSQHSSCAKCRSRKTTTWNHKLWTYISLFPKWNDHSAVDRTSILMSAVTLSRGLRQFICVLRLPSLAHHLLVQTFLGLATLTKLNTGMYGNPFGYEGHPINSGTCFL